MPDSVPTAAVLVIGNEILSGRTQDANIHWLAGRLTGLGIRLREARLIADREDAIVEAVNALRAAYGYVFVTGGIGPTHDDITSGCVARAFGVKLTRHPAAVRALEEHYGREELNEARLKMADVPEGAVLIANPVSAAPGYRIGNLYVMAGVPVIMRAMFDGIAGELQGGPRMLSRTLRSLLPEGRFAEALGKLQAAHPDVEIGSYPYVRMGRVGVSLVASAPDRGKLDAALAAIQDMIRSLGGEWEEEAARFIS